MVSALVRLLASVVAASCHNGELCHINEQDDTAFLQTAHRGNVHVAKRAGIDCRSGRCEPRTTEAPPPPLEANVVPAPTPVIPEPIDPDAHCNEGCPLKVHCSSGPVDVNFALRNLSAWHQANTANSKPVGSWIQTNLRANTATEFKLHLDAPANTVDTHKIKIDIMDLDQGYSGKGMEFVALCGSGSKATVARKGSDVAKVTDAGVKQKMLNMAKVDKQCHVFKSTTTGFGCDNPTHEGGYTDRTLFRDSAPPKKQCKRWVGKKGITADTTVGEATDYNHKLQQDRSISFSFDDIDDTDVSVVFGSVSGSGGRNFLFKVTLVCI